MRSSSDWSNNIQTPETVLNDSYTDSLLSLPQRNKKEHYFPDHNYRYSKPKEHKKDDRYIKCKYYNSV